MANFYKNLFRKKSTTQEKAGWQRAFREGRRAMLKKELLHQKYLAGQATDPWNIAKGTIIGLPAATKKVLGLLIFRKRNK